MSTVFAALRDILKKQEASPELAVAEVITDIIVAFEDRGVAIYAPETKEERVIARALGGSNYLNAVREWSREQQRVRRRGKKIPPPQLPL